MLEPVAPNDDQTLDGPVEGLSYDQQQQHQAGDAAFNEQVFTAATGLGPVFVATSCGSCHAGDGKGHPFAMLTRFGRTDSLGNNEYAHAPQLQNNAIAGYVPEELPAGAPHAGFTAPGNSGLGFLEAISEDDILGMAAANLNNADGVRGHANRNLLPGYLNPAAGSHNQTKRYICRFGKKASTYNLFQQTVGAYNQDIGITSTYAPKDVYSLQDKDPEISNNTIADVVFYLQTLKAPVQRMPGDPQVVSGSNFFLQTGCETCHKQTLKTGYSLIAPLSYQTIHPYTDLLVHDMGPGLDDGYTEGNATTAEWRTAPLWGLGLTPKSQGGQYYLLHDGRAHSIEDAILQHGGEATVSVTRYRQLSSTNKAALLTFLQSL